MRPWPYECGPEDPASSGVLGAARWLGEELSYMAGPGWSGRWDPPGVHCEPDFIAPAAPLPNPGPIEIRQELPEQR